MGRVFEASLGDLKVNGEEDAYRKFKLKVEAVQGTACLTNFYAMSLTTDKERSLVRKWHTLIEAHCDVKTTDGYVVRLFAIAFTAKAQNQHKKTSYAQAGQVRAIRKKMIDIMTREVSSSDLSEFVKKLITEAIGLEIQKAASTIYPLREKDVLIRKVKILKAPKTDLSKLLELHSGPDAVVDSGAPVERTDEPAQPAGGEGGEWGAASGVAAE